MPPAPQSAPHRTLDPKSVARALGGSASGNQVSAPAPGHSKQDRSLSVLVDPCAPDGFVVHAHAGEDSLDMRDYVRGKLGITPWHPGGTSEPSRVIAFPKASTKPYSDVALLAGGYEFVCAYSYTSEDGVEAFEVCRYEHPTKGKTFLQRHHDAAGKAISGRGDPMLYRLHELASRPDQEVYFVEGEKDADNLAALGLLATTVPNNSWPDDLSVMEGRTVYLLADNDAAGVRRALKAEEHLSAVCDVRHVQLPGLAEKGDVTDWIEAGGTAADLVALCGATKPAKQPTKIPKAANDNAPLWPGLVSSGDLVRRFTPPDYAIDGIVQSGFLYGVTASTGTGKTAILLAIAALKAQGLPLGDRGVPQGRVVYFAGENPDDVTMRWIGAAHHTGFNTDAIDVHFVPGVFDITKMFAHVSAAVERVGGAAMVVIDTSAAYFTGDDENGNVAMGKHARNLRALTTLPGSPCVLVACHPTKNADQSNLLPRGGGAFIAELDGNLTCQKTEAGTVKLHWQGKFRGPDFKPIHFDLSTVTAPGLVDSKGREIPTVMASLVSEGETRQRRETARKDEDLVLIAIENLPASSNSAIAEHLGWKDSAGEPHKRRAQTATTRLRRDKLADLTRGGWVLTKAGQSAATAARSAIARKGAGSRLVANMGAKKDRTDTERTDGYGSQEVDTERAEPNAFEPTEPRA